MSNIISHLILSWSPCGNALVLLSHFSNASLTYLISLHIAFHHRLFPFSLSKCSSSSTALGIDAKFVHLLPVLWLYFCCNVVVLFQYIVHPLCNSRLIINAICNSILATSTRYDRLTSFNGIQLELPSFHCWQSKLQACVVSFLRCTPFLITTNASDLSIAFSFRLEINNVIQGQTFVALFVNLRVKALCNQVSNR